MPKNEGDGRGREPRADIASEIRVSAAATPAERKRWKDAHDLLGLSMSDTMRSALERVAVRADRKRG